VINGLFLGQAAENGGKKYFNSTKVIFGKSGSRRLFISYN
jgi:hypothetical protein